MLRGLAAAISEAHAGAVRQEASCGLWLTGGDAALIWPLLEGLPNREADQKSSERTWAPDLVMQGLMRLKPRPGIERP